MLIARYDENKQYLKNEFTACKWDKKTGMAPEALEQQINLLWDARGDEPVCTVKARIQRYIVQNAQLELNPKSLFPGKFNDAILYDPKTGIAANGMYQRLFGRIREQVLTREMPEYETRWHNGENNHGDFQNASERKGIASTDTDFWHTMPDWKEIIRIGFPGMKERAIRTRDEKAAAGTLTREQYDFYESVLITLDAADICMDRLAAYAEQMPGTEEFTACIRFIRHHAPETLYHVMMVAIIYTMIEEMGCERSRTLGIIDSMYYPYYRHDIDNGIYTKEDVKELFRYFFGRWSRAGRFAAQPIAICGVDSEGRDAGNELTDLILDVYDEMDILNPKIQVRYHADLSPVRFRRLLSMIRAGHSAIVFINDDTVIRAYERIGIPKEIARNYVPFGCYEPMLMGKEDAMIGASWTVSTKAVEYLMSNGADMMTGDIDSIQTGVDFPDFDAFMAAFYRQLDHVIDRVIESIELQNTTAMKINPSPLYSASIGSCVERGRDVFDGGMEYSNISIKVCGIGTTVDALAAVKVLVYDQGVVSFPEMRKAVLNNWEGYEELRIKALKLKEKFGNHEPLTDRLAKEIYTHLFDYFVGRPTPMGGVYRMGGDSIDRCIYYGFGIGATPDGRRNGDAFSKNFNGTSGMEKESLTASVLSATEIDHTQFADACVYDYTAHPSAFEGEKGLDAMEALYRVYFARGGFALQGNVLNVDQLHDAQKHPEKYPNLQVRVCGWNEYFVNMVPEKQDALILRLEAR